MAHFFSQGIKKVQHLFEIRNKKVRFLHKVKKKGHFFTQSQKNRLKNLHIWKIFRTFAPELRRGI